MVVAPGSRILDGEEGTDIGVAAAPVWLNRTVRTRIRQLIARRYGPPLRDLIEYTLRALAFRAWPARRPADADLMDRLSESVACCSCCAGALVR